MQWTKPHRDQFQLWIPRLGFQNIPKGRKYEGWTLGECPRFQNVHQKPWERRPKFRWHLHEFVLSVLSLTMPYQTVDRFKFLSKVDSIPTNIPIFLFGWTLQVFLIYKPHGSYAWGCSLGYFHSYNHGILTSKSWYKPYNYNPLWIYIYIPL